MKIVVVKWRGVSDSVGGVEGGGQECVRQVCDRQVTGVVALKRESVTRLTGNQPRSIIR